MEAQKQVLISSFLEIAAGQSRDTAVNFLNASSWRLDEALQLYFVSIDDGRPSIPHTSRDWENFAEPLPVRERQRETLHGAQNLVQQQTTQANNVWESDSSDKLASLYSPPYDLMYCGSFHDAKSVACKHNRWLLVNLQSKEQFASHMLNRDTWSHKIVAETIKTNFIFWQVDDDSVEGKKVCSFYHMVSMPSILLIDPITGRKLSHRSGMVEPEILLEDLLQYVNSHPNDHQVKPPRESTTNSAPEKSEAKESTTNSAPEKSEEDKELLLALAASMLDVKDSATAEVTKKEPENSEEDKALLLAIAASMLDVKDSVIDEETKKEDVQDAAVVEETKKEEEVETTGIDKFKYPPLPQEPIGKNGSYSRVAIRLSDGRRVQRNFLNSEPIQLLWSFCISLVEEGLTRPFHFTLAAVPGVPKKKLYFENKLTFQEAELSNSVITLMWD